MIDQRSDYLLMAYTGVAVQNVKGSTIIHSSLRIILTQTNFYHILVGLNGVYV